MESLINILYTPLDCPPQPEVDLKEFRSWINVYWEEIAQRRTHLKNTGKVGEDKVSNFPWKLTSVYNNKDGWGGDFDKKFPELSKYFVEAFGLDLSDITSILLLPVKEDHEGWGFWHQDNDDYGLRMYLDFNDPEGKLVLKKTKLPYDNQPSISPRYHEKGKAPNIHDFLEDEIFDCKVIDPKQCYFLNNVRAAHATWTSKLGVSRIPVVIYHNNTKDILSKIEKLVLRSVEKYKDYVIRWDQ
jgi:hypothetical protein